MYSSSFVNWSADAQTKVKLNIWLALATSAQIGEHLTGMEEVSSSIPTRNNFFAEFIFTARKWSLRRLCFYTCLSVILFTGGAVSHHTFQVVSQHALQQVSGGGVVSQHALQVSRPTPRGEVEGSGQGGLQAHTQGEVKESGLGGLQAYIQGCLQAHTQGRCVSQHALRQAFAAGGTHPTGMHFCLTLPTFSISKKRYCLDY